MCSHLGDLLWDSRLPEAVQFFQEAVDAYEVASHQARSTACAKRVVEVSTLRRRPTERLDLLLTQYDRQISEIAENDDLEGVRADLQFKVATILQRRDRFAEAVERYRATLSLLRGIEGVQLLQAACHHRLGDLYHRELRDDRRLQPTICRR